VYEDELSERDALLRAERLAALRDNEGWKQDLRPLLVARHSAAMSGIRYEEEVATHWKAVGIEAHIEEVLAFVEGEKWGENIPEREEKPRWFKRLFRR
jgi:hypothetical protein